MSRSADGHLTADSQPLIWSHLANPGHWRVSDQVINDNHSRDQRHMVHMQKALRPEVNPTDEASENYWFPQFQPAGCCPHAISGN